MYKMISISQSPPPARKSVRFTADVDTREMERRNKENYQAVIKLLGQSSACLLKDECKARFLIDQATQLADSFAKTSSTYKKLMAKCYVEKALILPVGSERAKFVDLATILDPTDEKFILM